MTRKVVIKDDMTNCSYIRIIRKEYYKEYEDYLKLSYVEYILQVKKRILFFNIFVDIKKWSSNDENDDELWCEFQAKEMFDNIVYPFKNRMFLK